MNKKNHWFSHLNFRDDTFVYPLINYFMGMILDLFKGKKSIYTNLKCHQQILKMKDHNIIYKY